MTKKITKPVPAKKVDKTDKSEEIKKDPTEVKQKRSSLSEDELIREKHFQSAYEWAKQQEKETGVKYIIKSNR